VEHSDDQAAVRRAVADILVWMSGDRCTDELLAAVREKIEEALKMMRASDTKLQENAAS
jgi:chaperonin cofactor prefoldin